MKKTLHRTLTALLTLALLLPMGALAFEMEDISPDDWFYRYVMRGLDFGLITGTSEDSFHFEPNRPVTRAEFVTMLGRLHEYQDGNSIDHPADGAFYGRYLAWAVEHGIVLGDQHGDLMPRALITREQMAVMVYRYVGAFELQGLFDPPHTHTAVPDDYQDVSSWARHEVLQMMYWYRLMQGTGSWPGLFNPQANSSRAEALTVLVRLGKQLVHPTVPLCPELEMRIKDDWASKHPSLTPENVRIDHYFGTYNGKVALMIRDIRGDFAYVVWEQKVAGIVFHYSSGQQIHIWDNRNFVLLPQAYEGNLITAEDVRGINVRHRRAFPFMY